MSLNQIGQDRSQRSDLRGGAERDRLVEGHTCPRSRASAGEQLAVQGTGRWDRPGERHHGVSIGIERGQKRAHGGGLAAAHLTRDDGDAALTHRQREPGLELFHASGGHASRIGGAQGAGEGDTLQVVEMREHGVGLLFGLRIELREANTAELLP